MENFLARKSYDFSFNKFSFLFKLQLVSTTLLPSLLSNIIAYPTIFDVLMLELLCGRFFFKWISHTMMMVSKVLTVPYSVQRTS